MKRSGRYSQLDKGFGESDQGDQRTEELDRRRPEHLRADLRGLGLARQLDRIDRLSSASAATIEHRVTHRTLRSIAARVRLLTNQATELDIELLALVPQHPAGPTLLGEAGVGPVVAAQLLVSWSHRERVRNEAAFASLAGAAPLEASSGQRTRHRLSRMGDRNLNPRPSYRGDHTSSLP